MSSPTRRRRFVAAGSICVPVFGLLGGLGVTSDARARAARRVVCIGGAVTETVFALGAGERVVGADTTSTYPAAAQGLPRVGYARQVGAEGVLSLRPDMVLASHEAGPPAVLEQIARTGVTVVRLDNDLSFDGVLRRIAVLAQALDSKAAGATLTDELRAQWRATQQALAEARRRFQPAAAVAGRAAQDARPPVVFVLGHSGSPLVSGRDTAAHALIELAGGVNPLAPAFTGYKPLTPESMLGTAPRAILTSDESLAAIGGIDGLLARPGVALTPAGRDRRVVALPALQLLGFGPRLPQTVAQVADRIHA
jgi:iron complex transport system substrate-binding protein